MRSVGTGLALSIFVCACGPAIDVDDGAGTDDDSGGSTGSGTTATTTSTTATTTIGTTDGTSTTTTTTGTTGPAPTCAEDYVLGCQAYCATTLTCNPGPDGAYEECVSGCVDELASTDAACQVALCEAFACYGTIDCATLDAGAPECEALIEANDECFVGDDCFYGSSSDGQCQYGCDGEVERDLRCDVELCICTEDGVETAVCPSNDVCENFDVLAELAKSCCGW
jgi:hypothetical protein